MELLSNTTLGLPGLLAVSSAVTLVEVIPGKHVQAGPFWFLKRKQTDDLRLCLCFLSAFTSVEVERGKHAARPLMDSMSCRVTAYSVQLLLWG
jgi:hypothetical protein